MRRVAPVLLVWLLVAGWAAAETFEKEARFPLAAGSSLRVEMPVGQLRIVGGREPAVHVRLTVRVTRGSIEEARKRFEIDFQPGKEARLEIRMPSGFWNSFNKGEVTAEVAVPSETNLRADLGVGEMKIEGVFGDLRAHVGVGEMRLEVAEPSLYRSVRAHVGVGDVRHPFPGKVSGWLSKEYNGAFPEGRYRLDAEVGVGEIRISQPRVI